MPLLAGVESSEMYIHSAMADNETANPKINLPNSISTKLEVPEIKRAPMENMMALPIMTFFLPYLSTSPPTKKMKKRKSRSHLELT